MHRLRSTSQFVAVLLVLAIVAGQALSASAGESSGINPDASLAREHAATPEVETPTAPEESPTSTPETPEPKASSTPVPTPSTPTPVQTGDIGSAPASPEPDSLHESTADTDDSFAPAMIVTDPPGGASCTAPGGTTRAAPGGFVRYSCTWNTLGGTFQASTATNGWMVTVRRQGILGIVAPAMNGPAQSASVAALALANSYTVDVHVPASASSGDISITTITGGGTITVSTTVDASGYINDVSAGEYAEINCNSAPGSGWSVPGGGALDVQCTVGSFLNLGLLGLAELGLLEIDVRFPADWNLTVNVSGVGSFQATSGVLVLPLDPLLNLALAGGAPFTLSFLAPCNAEPDQVSIDTTLGLRTALTGPLVQSPGPNVLLQIAATEATGTISGAFQGPDPLMLGVASVSGLAGDTLPGSLTMNIERQPCAIGSASVQISSVNGSWFDAVSGASGVIPLANLTLTSVMVINPDAGITPLPPGGATLTSPIQIASFTPVAGASTYQLSLGTSLVVPAGTGTGRYRAEVIVTLVDGQTP